MLRILVLGSAAGGGLPQWNCRASISDRARRGDVAVAPRTQTSIAVTADNRRWILFDASPDLRQQMAESPPLHPSKNGPLRASPVSAVFLSGGDIDKIAGLLHLRERHRFVLFASALVMQFLADNPIFNALDSALVPRRVLPLDEENECEDANGKPLGIRVCAFAAPGKIPLYLEKKTADNARTALDGEAVGFRIVDSANPESFFFFVPGCARIDSALAARLDGAPLAMMDGTLFSDDEMIRQGLGEKTGARMGHISMSGADGAIASLAGAKIGRRIFVHINNSNSALADDSPERAEVVRSEWEVARDGMEIRL